MKANVCSKEIEYNGTIYKTDGKNWQVMYFGTYGPSCNGIPSHRFCGIDDSLVPNEVKRAQ